MKTIAFVIRDMGGAGMAVPLYLALAKRIKERELDVRLQVVSEDQGRRRWQAAGVEILHDCITEGVDLEAIREKLSWNDVAVVITAVGLPLHLERMFLERAIEDGKKSVVLEDQEGNRVHVRGLHPDMILSVNEATAREAQAEGAAAHCVSVGHHAKYAEPLAPALVAQVESLRQKFGSVFVLATSVTTTDVEAARAFAKRTGCCLVPRFHPKTLEYCVPGTKVTLAVLWREMLRDLGSQVVFLPDAKNTEEVICAADGVIAAYSTLLTTAALAGKRILCVESRESWALFGCITNGNTPPFPRSGAAYEILNLDGTTKMVRKTGEITPYDPDFAADAVLELLMK